MARKERRRRNRKQMKKEKARKQVEESAEERTVIVKTSAGGGLYTYTKKEKVSPLSFKKAFSLTFLASMLLFVPLFSGGAYIINPSQFLHLEGWTKTTWYVLGMGIGLLLALGISFYAAKKVANE